MLAHACSMHWDTSALSAGRAFPEHDTAPCLSIFCRTTELDVQWVHQDTWTYRREFEVGQEALGHAAVELLLAGIDTVAEVRLNGRLLLRAANFHRCESRALGQAWANGWGPGAGKPSPKGVHPGVLSAAGKETLLSSRCSNAMPSSAVGSGRTGTCM